MKTKTLLELLRLDPHSNSRITKLEVLLKRGPSTPAEIAAEAGCSPSNVLSVFYRLERYGIVSSKPTPSPSTKGNPTTTWTAANTAGTRDERLTMLLARCPKTQRTMQAIEILFDQPMCALEFARELGISKQMMHLRCHRMAAAGIFASVIGKSITYYVNHDEATKPVTKPRISRSVEKLALGAWV